MKNVCTIFYIPSGLGDGLSAHAIQTLEDKELALCFLKLLSPQPSEISSPSLTLSEHKKTFLNGLLPSGCFLEARTLGQK